jgi:hypothetical protein
MSKYFKKPPICEAAKVLKDCRATGGGGGGAGCYMSKRQLIF